MNALSVDVMNLLAANGFGAVGTNIFAMGWGVPDAQILILDSGGLDSPLKTTYEMPNFQILVRGEKGDDMNTSQITIRTVHEFLIDQPSEAIPDTLQFEPISTIAGLGRDDNDRAVFSMNYFTHRNAI